MQDWDGRFQDQNLSADKKRFTALKPDNPKPKTIDPFLRDRIYAKILGLDTFHKAKSASVNRAQQQSINNNLCLGLGNAHHAHMPKTLRNAHRSEDPDVDTVELIYVLVYIYIASCRKYPSELNPEAPPVFLWNLACGAPEMFLLTVMC